MSNQSGKGSKYRTFSTETFATNYDSICWDHPKRKKHNGKQDSDTTDGKIEGTDAGQCHDSSNQSIQSS